MHLIAATLLLIVQLTSGPSPSAAPLPDTDRDGISDELEQRLMRKFVPAFLVSAGECGGSPAEFQSGSPDPHPAQENGTIYGQVFPIAPAARRGAFVEVHYYHLWGRDCGRNAHPLDVEKVSALLSADTAAAEPEAWRAVYWYAGAHEDTVCDASHAAQASFLGADQKGARVWISSGKHASFLSPDLCRAGCGGDRCADMRPMPPAALVNIGERKAPMNGALWVDSPKWRLASKMSSDFTEAVLLKLKAAPEPGIVAVHGAHAPLKAVVRAGGSGAGAIGDADAGADKAIAGAAGTAGRSIDSSRKSAGRSLKSALRAAWRLLAGR